MIAEFENVTLTTPIPDHSLPKGAKGTVVDVEGADAGWVIVEFFDGDDTVAVLPVEIADLAPDVPPENPNGGQGWGTGFIFEHRVLYVPAWEWDSTKPTLLGLRVDTQAVHGADLTDAAKMGIGGRALMFRFENGRRLEMFIRHRAGNTSETMHADTVDILVITQDIGEGGYGGIRHSDLSPVDALAIIERVASQSSAAS